MADRYSATFDMESYGNRYQATNRTASCIQQQRRHYLNPNGPCMEDYDPSRLNPSTFTPTATTGRRVPSRPHQTLLPSTTGTATLSTPSKTAGMQKMQCITDFEPLPIGNAALQRLNPPHTVVATNTVVHHQTVFTTSLVPGTALKDMFAPKSSPISVDHGDEVWLERLEFTVSGISLEPMKGTAIVSRIQSRANEVATRYLPCVDFLVQCQQELRKGLALATRKNVVQQMFRDSMTPNQFYRIYIATLPTKFFQKNKGLMASQNLEAAFKELQKLCENAHAVQNQGCEAVKNTFLGGMKDGESWGLRKWLSKHGGALQICNDFECILNSCQKLDRSFDTTRKLGERLRPTASQALKRLKSEVPPSYQEQSSAHPYLPFFHRLESALRGMSDFDPEDDDVICIDDDDELEAIKSSAPTQTSTHKKRKMEAKADTDYALDAVAKTSEEDFVVEILDIKPAAKRSKTTFEGDSDDADFIKLWRSVENDVSTDFFNQGLFDSSPFEQRNALGLARNLDELASMFDSNQHWTIRPNNIPLEAFWDGAEKYACVLRLFSELLKSPDSADFVDAVDHTQTPSYAHVVKHPLCFRDVVSALLDDSEAANKSLVGNTGQLVAQGLSSWNMWRGKDLLQALDLVLLNSLAYGRATQKGQNGNRSQTNKLRKQLWVGIKDVLDTHMDEMDQDQRKRYTPTRRGETSGFVIYKDR
ncbi:unnamed protein product [Cylindrotheca closterium]|uniref:Bromo domain-containing protein n=1 Tax=Cylindrotheca closterium TaxID=2856 RepID=A0AAD2FSM1_9STRA|nr:unnamed protein product [Cylindrotheca closterium]